MDKERNNEWVEVRNLKSVCLETRTSKAGKRYDVIKFTFDGSPYEYLLFSDFRKKVK